MVEGATKDSTTSTMLAGKSQNLSASNGSVSQNSQNDKGFDKNSSKNVD